MAGGAICGFGEAAEGSVRTGDGGCRIIGGFGSWGEQIPAKFDLIGKTNLRQIVALLERCAGWSSGTIPARCTWRRRWECRWCRLMGPTDPTRTGPFGRDDSVVRLDLPCSPCYSRTCSHRSCMEWLEMDAILDDGRARRSSGDLRHTRGMLKSANIKILLVWAKFCLVELGWIHSALTFRGRSKSMMAQLRSALRAVVLPSSDACRLRYSHKPIVTGIGP